ncbi:hypothetical protein LTR62_001605 [Meristemomyces frigidus]|uniref:BIR-domain-containing protein n=1 Tax=Meristemomyces frigidus TaxID=1508187 RepID=A0AAN7T974_9PEZI|nr:hypothetical protein LTR62_001605 [Meristemomyces frigidus]
MLWPKLPCLHPLFTRRVNRQWKSGRRDDYNNGHNHHNDANDSNIHVGNGRQRRDADLLGTSQYLPTAPPTQQATRLLHQQQQQQEEGGSNGGVATRISVARRGTVNHFLSVHPIQSISTNFNQPNTVTCGTELYSAVTDTMLYQLARAGFFYRPAPDSLDNVQCFLCAVKLDGWEPADSPLREHLAHASSCSWAVCLSTARLDFASSEPPESRDPMSDELVAARRGTFEVGEGWAHENKRGWRCKTGKMVDAGWTFDRSPETEDGVTCFYCNLSLDGWEPKDDPAEEHRRRSPECPFFVLCEQYHGTTKPKGGKGRGRGSTASKASRLSTQSTVSVAVSEAPSVGEMSESEPMVDDSIMSTASQATVKGGKRKPGRPAKGTKGRKRVYTIEEPAIEEIAVHEHASQPARQSQAPGAFPDSSVLEPEPEAEAVSKPGPQPPARVTRKRQSKQGESSMIDSSHADLAPKKSTRGHKAKAQSIVEPEPDVEPQHRVSEVSAQLQHELDHSMEYNDFPDHESTPQQVPIVQPSRGVKRTSDGMKKYQDSSVVTGVEVPAPPQPVAAKANRGRKPSNQANTPQEDMIETSEGPAVNVLAISFAEPALDLANVSESEKLVEKTAAKGKKAPAKKGKGRKASSTRSSKATVIVEAEAEPEPEMTEAERLARDEAEIEAELERMAAEQAATAVVMEQEKVEEFEPSPSLVERHVHSLPEPDAIEPAREITPAVDSSALVVLEDKDASETRNPALSTRKPTATPSPTNSNKENQPSSLARPTTAIKGPHPQFLSPTKTTRIPLAPSTPNATRRSPRKPPTTTLLLSPTKQPFHLSPSIQWTPADLDALLLQSPQPTPGTLAARLVQAGGGLSEKEKGMSVEEWILWRAGQGEADVRGRCEGLVEAFEREGIRALGILGGV